MNSAKVPSFDYFDHDADIGIVGRGITITDAFVAAAHAVFAIMTDLSKIPLDHTIVIAFEEDNLDFALVTWLNLLIGKAREHSLVFAKFSLEKRGNLWQGAAFGTPWKKSLEHGVEVKGATLTCLSVKQNSDAIWQAQCVVDV